jgi:DNA-binding XRE family transcriptional regulator
VLQTSARSKEIAEFLGITQSELLDIFSDKFGNVLLETVHKECRNRPTKRAIRQWMLNNICPDRRRVSREVKAARYRAGLTQQELAQLLGIKKSLVVNIENARTVGVDRVRAIALVVNDVELNRLLFDIGWVDRF